MNLNNTRYVLYCTVTTLPENCLHECAWGVGFLDQCLLGTIPTQSRPPFCT